jgi:DNA-directed RNA polymerase subunit RPC12/RpoP
MLLDRLNSMEKAQVMGEVTRLGQEVSNLRGDLAKAHNTVAPNEFSLMLEALTGIKGELAAVRKDAVGLMLSRPAPQMSEADRTALTQGIETVLKGDAEAHSLAKDLFYVENSQAFAGPRKPATLPTQIRVVKCGNCGRELQVDLLAQGIQQGANYGSCPHCAATLDLNSVVAGQPTTAPEPAPPTGAPQPAKPEPLDPHTRLRQRAVGPGVYQKPAPVKFD